MSKSELRASQVLTTFGPGALMDLPETSIIIGGLDHWYYSGAKDPNIDEPRLIAKIRARLDNPHLTLRKPPANEDDQPGRTSGISGWVFPQWFWYRKLSRQRAELAGDWSTETGSNPENSGTPAAITKWFR